MGSTEPSSAKADVQPNLRPMVQCDGCDAFGVRKTKAQIIDGCTCPEVKLQRARTAIRKTAKPGKRQRPGRLKEGSKAWHEQRCIAQDRSRGICETEDVSVCTQQAEHLHHKQLRSRGGSDYADNLLDVCNPCHRWIHEHPSESTELGYMAHGWSAEA